MLISDSLIFRLECFSHPSMAEWRFCDTYFHYKLPLNICMKKWLIDLNLNRSLLCDDAAGTPASGASSSFWLVLTCLSEQKEITSSMITFFINVSVWNIILSFIPLLAHLLVLRLIMSEKIYWNLSELYIACRCCTQHSVSQTSESALLFEIFWF